MKLNTAYGIKLLETKQISYIKKLNACKNQLDCTAERARMYGGYSFTIKKNEDIVIILLAKAYLGYIVYLCNSVYSVGNFLYITDKELEGLSNLNFKPIKKTYITGQWRHFWSKDLVIAEFVHPLDQLKQERTELLNDYENTKKTESDILVQLNENELERKRLNKRFGIKN